MKRAIENSTAAERRNPADQAATEPQLPLSSFAWIRSVGRYQWLVLLVAWLGWVFDSMDGTLFNLIQKPSMTELMGPGADDAAVALYSRIVLAVMLLGWAAGGIVLGTLADYI